MEAPFTRLASVIQLLASGASLELAFVPGPRNTEWAEYFALGASPYDSEETLLHAIRTRKNDVVKEMRAEPCFWSLDEMLQSLQEWGEETISLMALPPFIPGQSAYLDALARLDESPERYMAAGTAWQAEVRDGKSRLVHDGDGKWTLDELVIAVKSGK